MKYAIKVKKELLFDVIRTVEGGSPEDAMAVFAALMDTDMNRYFRAVPEEKNELDNYETQTELQRQFHLEFMMDRLGEDFGFEDDDAINEIAEEAYGMYLEGDGRTEYECLEDAVADWDKANGNGEVS